MSLRFDFKFRTNYSGRHQKTNTPALIPPYIFRHPCLLGVLPRGKELRVNYFTVSSLGESNKFDKLNYRYVRLFQKTSTNQ